MSKPQPISTAPVGMAVLTDLGIAKLWTDGDWTLCYTDSALVYDANSELVGIYPTLWIPLPNWVKP
jgi:hypothetical protein